MSDRPTRVIALLCVLLGVWIATYWLYQPAARRITLDPTAAPLARVSPALEPQPEPRPRARAAPERADPAPPTPGTRRVQKVVEPRFRDYMVQPGDTNYERIAARTEVFGDARLSPAIARSNPWVSPDRLKPGITVLKIPLDPANVQGKMVFVEEPLDPMRGAFLPAVPIERPEPPPAPKSEIPSPQSEIATTYVIQKDDTLWDLSKKFYGKGALWKRLAEANRDVIPNPDHPPVGVTIRVPAAP